MKRGRKPKYKTEAERKAAHLEAVKRWQLKNPEKAKKIKNNWVKKNPEKVNAHLKKHREKGKEILNSEATIISTIEAGFASIESKMDEFKSEQKEILLTLEEVLKDNKKFMDFMKWGKK